MNALPTLPVTINNLDGTETLAEDCHRYYGPPIPRGTVSDGASVPWLLRRFWPAFGCWYDRAIIGHDWRYRTHNCTRREADIELWKNMDMDLSDAIGDCETTTSALMLCAWGGFTCAVFYYAVRLFGWYRWGKGKP